jgi:hypothetical protein
MKKVVLGLVCALVLAGGLYAQENDSRHIKPTFGMGFISSEFASQSETLTATFLGVDFVNRFGLTFGLQTLMAWNNDMADIHTFYGAGYTFVAPQWSAGVKLMAAANMNTGGLGLDANGTWWFMENLGLTASLNYFFSIGDIDWNTFGFWIGASTRF